MKFEICRNLHEFSKGIEIRTSSRAYNNKVKTVTNNKGLNKMREKCAFWHAFCTHYKHNNFLNILGKKITGKTG